MHSREFSKSHRKANRRVEREKKAKLREEKNLKEKENLTA